jgi:uncharacterized membrane protein
MVMSTLSVLGHYCFHTFEDLAMFDQMLWNLRQGRDLITTLSGNHHLLFLHHFFGEHLSPILYLLAPLAGLTRGSEALLIIQALAITLAAVPAALWAERVTGWKWMRVFAAWFWVALPGLWKAGFNDFHMDALGPVFFFSFLLRLYEGRRSAWLWAALYAATKEDAPFYLATAAAVGGLLSGRRKIGFAISAVAAVYGVVGVLWIMPVFSGTGEHLLGNRLPEIGSPGDLSDYFLAILKDPRRWKSLAEHLKSFGFLPILGGLWILPAALTVGIMWLSSSVLQYTIGIYYSLTVYPFLFVACVAGMRSLARFPWLSALRGWRVSAQIIAFILCIVGLAFAWPKAIGDIWSEMGPTSLSHAQSTAEARRLLAHVPSDANLAAEFALLPHVARREQLSIVLWPGDADWLALYLNSPYHHYPLEERRNWKIALTESNSAYGVYGYASNQVVVLRAGYSTSMNEAVLKEFKYVYEAKGLYHEVGRAVEDSEAYDGWAWMVRHDDPAGCALYGPYVHLEPGGYTVNFRIKKKGVSDRNFAALEVVELDGETVRGRAFVRGRSHGYHDVTLPVELKSGKNTEFRCNTMGGGELWIDRIWLEKE